MIDKVFLDTNIIVYSYSDTENHKQTIARSIITINNSYISTQVVQELINTITKKYKFTYADAINATNESCQNNNIFINTEKTILSACHLAEKYGYSFYDSLIIAAALSCNCTILYSEDMKNGQFINETLRIVNPFITN